MGNRAVGSLGPSDVERPTGAEAAPTLLQKFTWDMGARKWGWSTNPIANDSPHDRLLMATTTSEERADIGAYYLWSRYCAATPPADTGG